MPQRYSRFIPMLSLSGDFIILNLILVVGFCWVEGVENCFEPFHITFYLYLNLMWFIMVLVFGGHRIDRNMKPRSFLVTYIQIIVFFFFFFLMYFQVKPFVYYPRDWWKYIFPAYFFLLILWKMSLYYSFVLYRKWGFNYRTAIIIGHDRSSEMLIHYFNTNPWHGYRYVGAFANDIPAPSGNLDNSETADLDSLLLGSLDELGQYLAEHHIDEVYIAWSSIPREKLNQVFAVLDNQPVKVRVIPDLQDFSFRSADIITYGDIPVIQIHPGPLSYWYNRIIKRIFDIGVSFTVITTVLSWLTPLLWLASLLGSRQGVFFRQQRTAADGKAFTCLKYRSMRDNPEADKTAATRNDIRVTPLGRLLRKTSIDELPQFFNVLKGEMSVVGPRPHMLVHTEEYRRLIKRFMLRHTVKPGITGLAQVNGYRGEITSVEDIQKRVEHDVRYIENWTLQLDLRIILRTAFVLSKGQEKAY